MRHDIRAWRLTGGSRSSKSSKSRDVVSSTGLTWERWNLTNGNGYGSTAMGTGARRGEQSDEIEGKDDTGGLLRRCVSLTVGGAEDESSAQGSG